MGSRIDIHVYGDLHIHLSQDDNLATTLHELERNMTAEFDALRRAVEEEGTVIDGAIVLLDQLAANRDDPAALSALMNEVATKRDQLATALVRNTRAASVEPSTPTPAPGSMPGMTTGNNEGGQVTGTGSQIGATETQPTAPTTPAPEPNAPTTETPAPTTDVNAPNTGTPPSGGADQNP